MERNENETLKDLLLRCRPFLAMHAEEVGYGFYRPANPHDFTPDGSCCTPDEIAAHKAACDAYDRGEYKPDTSDGWVGPDMHILRAPWGIGSYTIRDEEACALLDEIAALATSANLKEPQQ